MERKLRYFEEQLRKAGVWNLVERPPAVRYQEYCDSVAHDEVSLVMDKLEVIIRLFKIFM